MFGTTYSTEFGPVWINLVKKKRHSSATIEVVEILIEQKK